MLFIVNYSRINFIPLRVRKQLLLRFHVAFVLIFPALLLLPGLTPSGLAQVINTVAGNGSENVPAISAQLSDPFGVAVDGSGNLYIADRANHRIRKVSPSGMITTVAGTGAVGYSGDGGQATCARLYSPFGVAVDGSGNLYIADFGNCRIRKVNTLGVITTVAGNGTYGYGGDGGPATSAVLNYPLDVAVDGSGSLFIADRSNNRIRKVSTAGVITTVAGTGNQGYSGDGGQATSARLNFPHNVAVDGIGNLYISDTQNNRIRKVDMSGAISTIAGTGIGGYSGDGGPATSAQLDFPYSIVVDISGNLFIADNYNHRIRKVNTSGVISTMAGTGGGGYSGDGGPATSADLYSPFGLAIDGSGNLYIGDHFNNRIRKVNPTGVINPVVGNGTNGSGGYSGDGGQATSAQLNTPTGVAVDGSGNLYVADQYNHCIRKVSLSGIITTVAGTGNQGYGGDGGPATSADLYSPTGVAVDDDGNLYIADQSNHRIRKVNTSGMITTVAGTGNQGYSGDSGLATSAYLNSPTGIAVDISGNLFIADNYNHRIRKVNTSGVIATVAGGGYGSDGGQATFAYLDSPTGVTVDGSGNLYIADQADHRIRKVNTSGVITTVAGDGTGCDNGDCGQASFARLNSPFGIAVDGNGNLYIADGNNHRIRKVTNAKVLMITLKAGNWTDPGVWSCGRVPVSTDTIQINHAVSLPDSYQGRALNVYYGANGRLLINAHSSLQLGLP